jgi:hypothetical protein
MRGGIRCLALAAESRNTHANASLHPKRTWCHLPPPMMPAWSRAMPTAPIISGYSRPANRVVCRDTLRADDRVERESVSNSEVTAVATSFTDEEPPRTSNSTCPKTSGVAITAWMHDKGLSTHPK